MSQSSKSDVRTYKASASIVFRKTNEEFGGLSNMAGGFPLRVGDVSIYTSEALYQACRFPHLPAVQGRIIAVRSPIAAKFVSRAKSAQTRSDWEVVKVRVMRWCLRVKLAQNWSSFGKLLASTTDKPIVELSRADDFWGAVRTKTNELAGRNILGRLLTELREKYMDDSEQLHVVKPAQVENFSLLGASIPMVERMTDLQEYPEQKDHQPGLFDS